MSGGLDSAVLLDMLAGLAPRHPFFLDAVHVNHGLSPNADDWADACGQMCARYGVFLTAVPVAVVCEGRGIEDAARRARYQALWQHAGAHLATAHNRDDQAETLLLHLLRGAGPAGLAAMRPCIARRARRLLRPLLDVPRAEIEAYARGRGLHWVEDESNREIRFTRNFIRHRLLPLMEEAFPAARATLARAAEIQADAAAALHLDADARTGGFGNTLSVSSLRNLDPPVARNVLVNWLRGRGMAIPSAARVEEILAQMTRARPDAQPRVDVGGRWIGRHGDRVHLVEPLVAEDAAPIPWHRETELSLWPGMGRLQFRQVMGEGLCAEAFREPPVVTLWHGGGKLARDEHRGRRRLSALFQEGRVPAWERRRTPMLIAGDTVVWVAGLGYDHRFLSPPDAPGWVVSWARDSSVSAGR